MLHFFTERIFTITPWSNSEIQDWSLTFGFILHYIASNSFANFKHSPISLAEIASTSNDVVFAGIASLPRSITELSIIDANKDEYVTRHLVDGRIIFCDHRVSVVAGYLSEEVSGRSAFGFMHKDDYKWTMLGLQQSKHLHFKFN